MTVLIPPKAERYGRLLGGAERDGGGPNFDWDGEVDHSVSLRMEMRPVGRR